MESAAKRLEDSEPDNREEMLEKMRALVSELERGDGPAAVDIIEDLTQMRESDLFQEMGKLTRQLHQALSSLQVDPELVELAEDKVPDAKQRLDYVISKTEESAHVTLGAVEASMPVSDSMAERAAEIKEHWLRFKRRELGVNEFNSGVHELIEFLDSVQDGSRRINTNLSAVLMAQDFQDLTGQVIRRVIELVQEVEDNLVRLVRMGGGSSPAGTPAPGKVNRLRAEGPRVDSASAKEVVSGQDEVDDLLSSLGF